jgi:hypothetical protein
MPTSEIMDLRTFKKETEKLFSKRNGRIRDIDTALAAYHNPANTHLKDDKLRELKDAIDAFVAEKTHKYRDPTKRKTRSSRQNGVDLLHQQVRLKIQPREDLTFHARVFTGFRRTFNENHVIKLADRLIADKVKVDPDVGQPCIDKLKSMYSGVRDYMLGLDGEALVELVKAHPIWRAYADGTSKEYRDGTETIVATGRVKPKNEIRICTMDVASLVQPGLNQDPEFVVPTPLIMKKPGDTGAELGAWKLYGSQLGQTEQMAHPPIADFPPELRKKVVEYLKAFLGRLGSQVRTTLAAAGTTHRAIVAMDWYSLRPTSSGLLLHKDTMGNTLFVALHYLNEQDMQGPEYIDDPMPVRCRPEKYPDFATDYYTENEWFPEIPGGNCTRPQAPWLPAGDSWVWPEDLLEAIQIARGANTPAHECEIKLAGNMPPYGLVSFVDELINHATPLGKHRPDSEKRLLNAGVSLGEGPQSTVNLYGDRRVRRRYSMAMNEGANLAPVEVQVDDRPVAERKFVRLWIGVVPRSWFTTKHYALEAEDEDY